ncbi:tyrosine-type recombinase/integrase [Demequina rhizosphaerae]|uniref:tyrosine-type recombinase/integrase n=1 Tax=Demequina rhizosphaerae TaxID=1638985 RepID=UPI000785D1DF|nr:site-specific integrase [Demequina rhizosphaerae]
MASVDKRPNGKYRARYYDAARKQHARHFARKIDAKRWLDEVTAAVVTGRYVDPGAGRITLHAFAEEVWRPAQQHRPGTQALVRGHLGRHVYPALGDRPLDSIHASDIQALVTSASKHLSPATVTVIYRYVSSIFKAAVRDRRILESPCVEIKLPKAPVKRVEPITTATVEAIIEAVPPRYRALVVLAAGTGMRQGEVFGLTTDRVDFLARRIIVDRQLTTVSNERPTFGPVKTDASNRRIPLPMVVGDALLEHLARFEPGADGLIFTNDYGEPLRRSGFNQMWAKALASAGIGRTVFHSLRHYYASLLIRHGESVKAVQERLGHASATETLDTYSHLWPDSDDRTREAVDAVLGLAALENLKDSPRTPGASR